MSSGGRTITVPDGGDGRGFRIGQDKYQTHESYGAPGSVLGGLYVPALLFGVDVPHDVVWQANDLVACPSRHFGEAFRLGLVLEGVARKVDAWIQVLAVCRALHTSPGKHTGPVDVGLDENVYATDAVELQLLVLVVPPVAHLGHVRPASVILVVAWHREHQYHSAELPGRVRRTFGEHDVLVQAVGQFAALVRLDPRVIVNCRTHTVSAPTLRAVVTPFRQLLTSSLDVDAVLVPVEPDVCKASVSRGPLLARGQGCALLLGTRISLSWAMKSSRILPGLSTMSTSRQ